MMVLTLMSLTNNGLNGDFVWLVVLLNGINKNRTIKLYKLFIYIIYLKNFFFVSSTIILILRTIISAVNELYFIVCNYCKCLM